MAAPEGAFDDDGEFEGFFAGILMKVMEVIKVTLKDLI